MSSTGQSDSVGTLEEGASRFSLSIPKCVALSDEQGNGEALKDLGGLNSLAEFLHTDLRDGINNHDLEVEILQRQRKYGQNKVPEPPIRSYLQLLYAAVAEDTTMLILCAAAVVSLIIAIVQIDASSTCQDFDHTNQYPEVEDDDEDHSTEWVDAAAILAAVVAVSNVTAFNDWQKEKQFQKLNEASRNTSVFQVSRGGLRMDVQVQNLVVGDIVHINAGTKLPTDGVVATCDNLSCDESAVTGESDVMLKNLGDYLKTGAMVQSGGGSLLVTSVGVNTDAGRAVEVLSEGSDGTPLQQKLNVMATLIGYGGMVMAVLTFISVCIRFTVCRCDAPSEEKFYARELLVLFDFVILGVTIVVVAVPEGLPLAVTISLAYSMRKMMNDNNLVRKLQACETMGGVTNICSDKTGTLTQNRMTVTRALLLGNISEEPWWEKGGKTIDPEVLQTNLSLTDDSRKSLYDLMIQGLIANTEEASYVRWDEKMNGWEFLGSKTECALLLLAIQQGHDFEAVRNASEKRRIVRINFTSDRKKTSTVLKLEDNPNQCRVYTTGAAEIVLGTCTNHVTSGGGVEPMSDNDREFLLDQIRQMTSTGLRSLVLAYKDVAASEAEAGAGQEVLESRLENNLTVLAILGIKDPVRAAVPKAVADCQGAGIMVRMVTGDNLETASHIARECGILKDGDLVMEGKEFREMTAMQRIAILPRLAVLARSKPTDKHTLVLALKQQGEVVAVTGDGTNDAPALKEADVGLSMGLSGTDVAKKASDIVILDDNFASIVRAVQWGRNVYDSIRKFLQFQLTINVAALFIAYMGSVVQGTSPLSPIQLLWVNLIMDTLAALALATEEPTAAQLKRKPYGRYESLVNGRMWLNILGQATLQCAVLLVMLFKGEDLYMNDQDHQTTKEKEDFNNTMIFNSFVFMQLFNELNARELGTDFNIFKGILNNHLFMSVLFITTACQIGIVQGLGSTFNCVPLTTMEFVTCVCVGSISLPMGALLKCLPVPPLLRKLEHIKPKNKNKDMDATDRLELSDLAVKSRYASTTGKDTSAGQAAAYTPTEHLRPQPS